MLANVVKGQKMAFTKMLARKGFFQTKMQGMRSFSSVMGGAEGSTVSVICLFVCLLFLIRVKKELVTTR